MNLETFFSNFELFADAPNGVQKLRELILQLAVQGKLVPQNPDDETAAVLLEKIKEEKERLVKEGKIKKSKKLPDVDLDEVAFELPKVWEWVRLGEIAKVIEYGTSYKSVDTGETVPIFRMNNIKNGQITFNNLKYVPESIKDLPRLYLINNDILFNRTNSYELVGKTGIFKADNNKYTFASYLIRISLYYDYVNPEFVNISMNSCYFRQTQIEPEITQQCGQANFNGTKLKNSNIPLPPLNEQHRIVAKVDALMKLCDELETRQHHKRDRILKLGEVATTKLITPSTQETFNQHWKTISDNFDLLYSIPENVKQLRQAILQLAVMGKLVPQNPDDEPASVLLEKIKEEKERLVKEGKIKKSKKLPDVDVGEMAFELPMGWEWVRLGDATLLITDGEHKTPTRISTHEIPLATAKNVRDGHLDLRKTDFVSLETAEKCWKRCQPKHNDILMVCVGATTGRLCLIKEPPKIVMVRSVALIRPFEKHIYPEYLTVVIKTSLVQIQIWNNVKQSAQPCLYINKMQILNIPLPPLNEQYRIVTKVNQMMRLCDELEAKLTQSIEDREKLMSAAVRQVLAA